MPLILPLLRTGTRPILQSKDAPTRNSGGALGSAVVPRSVDSLCSRRLGWGGCDAAPLPWERRLVRVRRRSSEERMLSGIFLSGGAVQPLLETGGESKGPLLNKTYLEIKPRQKVKKREAMKESVAGDITWGGGWHTILGVAHCCAIVEDDGFPRLGPWAVALPCADGKGKRASLSVDCRSRGRWNV